MLPNSIGATSSQSSCFAVGLYHVCGTGIRRVEPWVTAEVPGNCDSFFFLFQFGPLYPGQETHLVCGVRKVTRFPLRRALPAGCYLVFSRALFRFPALSRALSPSRFARYPIRMKVRWYSRRVPSLPCPLVVGAVRVQGFSVFGSIGNAPAQTRRSWNPARMLLPTIRSRRRVWIVVVSPGESFRYEGSVRRGVKALNSC